MQKIVTLRLKPSEDSFPESIHLALASEAGVQPSVLSGYQILKRSMDARSRHPVFIIQFRVFLNEPFIAREKIILEFRILPREAPTAIIVGAGPAGMFAALRLLEAGIRPILLERGKEVRSRRRDLAILNREGHLNPESNYCYGEGGAGTYSDGKLYTRSAKRGDVDRILNLFVQFGAGDHILFDAHPHIGTNKLPGIITAIRQQIESCGGEFHFECRLVDFSTGPEGVAGLVTADGKEFRPAPVILATGHSARDIFRLLQNKKIMIESKAFALGLRIEHPQELIDQIQYHGDHKDPLLPPATYNFVEQVDGKPVFSFCMCPGGIIAPASTSAGELVVNGWSPSKRNNPFANSGMVVSVDLPDLADFQSSGPLAGMEFQQTIEQKAYQMGGGDFVAPAQRLTDLVHELASGDLPRCSYQPGIRSVPLGEVLPRLLFTRLQQGIERVGKKMKGFYTHEAIAVATESRTSSPIRIPRDKERLSHPQLPNLYPCGEGAGYAGGIMSAAMDGEKVANAIIKRCKE
jgi:uncharacterized FAD-dependent dehydrogenase